MPLGAARLSLLAYQATVAAAAARTAVTFTAQDNAVRTTHEQYKFGGGAVEMGSGSTDWILVDHTAQDIDYGDDFTYEFWFRTSSLPSLFYMFASGSTRGDYIALYNKSGTWTLAAPVSNGSTVYTQIRNIGSTPATNTWHHIALVKDGSNLNMFFNGTLLTVNNGSAGSMSSTYGWDGVNRIGAWATNTSYGFAGHLDEVRFSKSVRYTSSFTPSTSAFVNDSDTQFLLHCDGLFEESIFVDDTHTPAASPTRTAVNPTFYGDADLDTYAPAFGITSLKLQGTNDFVTSPSNSITVGTGDCTYEFYFRATNLTNYQAILDHRDASTDHAVALILRSSGGGGRLYLLANNTTALETASSFAANTWYHIALQRTNGLWEMYRDGVKEAATYTNSNSFTTTQGLILGSRFQDGAQDFNGRFDEVRVSTIARYTSNFGKRGARLDNDSDTLLLYHFAGADGSTSIADDNS